MNDAVSFDEAFRLRLHDLFVWRRDVRRFRVDAVPAGTLERLIEVACLAPSVGLSEPWRFVVVDDPARRPVGRNQRHRHQRRFGNGGERAPSQEQ